MCRTVAAALKPGGRFVTVNNNPAQSPDRFEATRPYGFIKSAGELRPGAPITYTVFLESGEEFSFDDYYLSVEAHERAAERGRPGRGRVASSPTLARLERCAGPLGRLLRRPVGRLPALPVVLNAGTLFTDRTPLFTDSTGTSHGSP